MLISRSTLKLILVLFISIFIANQAYTQAQSSNIVKFDQFRFDETKKAYELKDSKEVNGTLVYDGTSAYIRTSFKGGMLPEFALHISKAVYDEDGHLVLTCTDPQKASYEIRFPHKKKMKVTGEGMEYLIECKQSLKAIVEANMMNVGK
jgi:hypothetical protein